MWFDEFEVEALFQHQSVRSLFPLSCIYPTTEWIPRHPSVADRGAPTVHRVGIVMNGVTGRMGTNQHLLRSIVAIREQGRRRAERHRDDPAGAGPRPAATPSSWRSWPSAPAACRGPPTSREALADSRNTVYFDAQTTDRRVDGVRRAIELGKHVYCEKPTALTTDEALDLYRRAEAAGVEARRRAGQALAARHPQAPGAPRLGLLRRHPVGPRRVRLLGLRGRRGAGAAAVVELPRRGRRRDHPRHALPLALRARQRLRGGPGRSRASGRRTWRRAGTSRASRTTSRPTTAPTPRSSSTAASWRTSTRRGRSACAATTC